MEVFGLIAPCGMNCGTCLAYLRKKNRCLGCRENQPNARMRHLGACVIRNCEELKSKEQEFCGSWCGRFPCRRLKALNKRYEIKYGVSFLENLQKIEEVGMKRFMILEEKKWRCQNCGDMICVHKGKCLNCEIMNHK